MPKLSYTYKALNRTVGQAIHHYDMIADGDRIAVALSGGKDSLMLLWILTDRLSRIPINYDLHAIYLDPGFDGGFSSALTDYCQQMGYRLHIEHTSYGTDAHSAVNRENPCFLCSRKRRKRLFEIADELDCRKLALGHNKDDIIETLFLNICFAGEISTMVPSQSLFKGNFTIIRPLAHTEEATIRKLSAELHFPDFINPCPSANSSSRQTIKEILQQLYEVNCKIKGNIFKSLSHVKKEYLLK
ncbi:MAG: ATP-binding protein [Desulfobacterales bacterium]|nr:ATP-binding protein [Desulfobacterales bacterium]